MAEQTVQTVAPPWCDEQRGCENLRMVRRDVQDVREDVDTIQDPGTGLAAQMQAGFSKVHARLDDLIKWMLGVAVGVLASIVLAAIVYLINN